MLPNSCQMFIMDCPGTVAQQVGGSLMTDFEDCPGNSAQLLQPLIAFLNYIFMECDFNVHTLYDYRTALIVTPSLVVIAWGLF